ncbi:CECR1, partial [Symbiodinium sp. CCMP2456]
ADLLKLLVIQEEDEMLTSPQIWSKFADVFVRLGDFFTNRLAVEEYLRATLQDFLADGVSHVELRIDLFHDSGLYDLDGREYQ